MPMGVPDVEEATEVAPEEKTEPLFELILFDDNDHSYDYVISMLSTLFSIDPMRAERMAHEVDHVGQVTIKVCPKEEAVQGRDQIHRFGPDPLIPWSTSSMRAAVEPAS